MFREILHRLSHTNTPAVPTDENFNELLPIYPGAVLLAQRQKRIQHIAALVGIPDEHFERLYLSTLTAYAAFVQQLPVVEMSQSSHRKSLLDHTLERVIVTLSRRQGYLLPVEAEPEVIAAKADLWTYSAFTAALLMDVSQLVVALKITLFDDNKKCLGRWDALRGPMKEPAAWYRTDVIFDPVSDVNAQLAPMLGRFVVSKPGLNWLWHDQTALPYWFGALIGNPQFASILGEMVGLVPTSPEALTASNTLSHEHHPSLISSPSIGDRHGTDIRHTSC